MSILNRRAIKTGIKNGDGFTRFQEKFGIDEEGLKKQIRFLYNNNQDTADELIREIAKNEKKFQKMADKKPITEYRGVPIEKVMDMSIEELIGLENSSEVESSDDIQEAPKVSEEVMLEEEIHGLEDEKIKLESQRKQWLSQHRASLKQMDELDEDLTALREKLVRIKEKYNCIAERDNKIVAKANANLKKQQEVKVVLEEKRQKLEKLHRIVIGVCADGTVALLENSSVELDDTGWETIFSDLSNPHRTECQDLRMREITAVAKILAIVKNDDHAHQFELAFDNDEMENAYFSADPSWAK